MSAVNEDVLPGRSGVQIDLSIDLRLTLTKPLPAVKKGPMKLWACLATTTSDGEFIECVPPPARRPSLRKTCSCASAVRSFRRTRMDHLLKSPKQVDLSVVLLKPSQRIIVSASCDLIGASRSLYKSRRCTTADVQRAQPVPRSRRSSSPRRGRPSFRSRVRHLRSYSRCR